MFGFDDGNIILGLITGTLVMDEPRSPVSRWLLLVGDAGTPDQAT